VNLDFQQVAAMVQLIKAVGGGWSEVELQSRNSTSNSAPKPASSK
jgi:hypothetical protein